jgi:predicted transcriptional regulator
MSENVPGIDKKSPEWIVLKALGDSGPLKILNFEHISERTGLERSQVRSACRRLRTASLASYETGGSVGGGYKGAGYMITTQGEKALGFD